MGLLVYRKNRREVFLFKDGLGKKVWEAEPITRFKFKSPIEKEYIQKLLSANYPTSGIVFEGEPYIGTNDGFIYGSEGKIQRIPDVYVDSNIFLEEYPFESEQDRLDFNEFRKKQFDYLKEIGWHPDFVERTDKIMKTNDLFCRALYQEGEIGDYIRSFYPWFGIKGFAVDSSKNQSKPILYDASWIGITDTLSNRLVCEDFPRALYQVGNKAAFVPNGDVLAVENGLLVRNKKSPYVDYVRDLLDIPSKQVFLRGICPRDGSGGRAAKFATDGEVVAISHGNHPGYILDIIQKEENNRREKRLREQLNPSILHTKLLIHEGEVFADYGNKIRNFSRDEDAFIPKSGEITSISDSGLVTVLDGKKTMVYNIFDQRKADILNGDFVFLQSAPQ